MYRKTVLVFIVINIILFNCSSKNNDDEVKSSINEPRWVTATIGLNVRSEPNIDSDLIFTLSYSSKVLLLEEYGSLIKIAGSLGKWSKVKYNDKTGWVFGGFLSRKEPSDLNNILIENGRIYYKINYRDKNNATTHNNPLDLTKIAIGDNFKIFTITNISAGDSVVYENYFSMDRFHITFKVNMIMEGIYFRLEDTGMMFSGETFFYPDKKYLEYIPAVDRTSGLNKIDHPDLYPKEEYNKRISFNEVRVGYNDIFPLGTAGYVKIEINKMSFNYWPICGGSGITVEIDKNKVELRNKGIINKDNVNVYDKSSVSDIIDELQYGEEVELLYIEQVSSQGRFYIRYKEDRKGWVTKNNIVFTD